MTYKDPPIVFGYTNYRGEYAVRRVVSATFHFGATKWHPEPQWLVNARDVDRDAWRDFALKDMEFSLKPSEDKGMRSLGEIMEHVDLAKNAVLKLNQSIDKSGE